MSFNINKITGFLPVNFFLFFDRPCDYSLILKASVICNKISSCFFQVILVTLILPPLFSPLYTKVGVFGKTVIFSSITKESLSTMSELDVKS